MTYPEPHNKSVAGLKAEFRSNDSPGHSGALDLLSRINK